MISKIKFTALATAILLAMSGCSKKPADEQTHKEQAQEHKHEDNAEHAHDHKDGEHAHADTAVATPKAVAEQFRKVAHAMYSDSLTTATALQAAIEKLVAEPTDANLQAARVAYKATRAPYQQSEILRFDTASGNVSEGLDKDGGLASVDDWEGQVNAWPLDEALIDYVDTSYVGEYKDAKNIINTIGKITVNGATVDVSTITPDVLASLNEIGGSEANVATGVHAIEFLLWGQDTNGTKAGAGNRPATDYSTTACTNGATKADKVVCERRGQYLKAAAQLLVDDLTAMNAEWNDAAATTKGTLAYDFLNNGKAIKRMIKSMGDMSAGELASERMRISVLNGSTEDEHDCFSDLTHVAIQGNAQGIVNAFRGSYTKIDGTTVSGASLKDLVASKDAKLAEELDTAYSTIITDMKKISATAEGGLSFDQQIMDANAKKDILKATDELDSSAILLGKASKIIEVDAGEFDQGTCDTNDKASCES